MVSCLMECYITVASFGQFLFCVLQITCEPSVRFWFWCWYCSAHKPKLWEPQFTCNVQHLPERYMGLRTIHTWLSYRQRQSCSPSKSLSPRRHTLFAEVIHLFKCKEWEKWLLSAILLIIQWLSIDKYQWETFNGLWTPFSNHSSEHCLSGPKYQTGVHWLPEFCG